MIKYFVNKSKFFIRNISLVLIFIFIIPGLYLFSTFNSREELYVSVALFLGGSLLFLFIKYINSKFVLYMIEKWF